MNIGSDASHEAQEPRQAAGVDIQLGVSPAINLDDFSSGLQELIDSSDKSDILRAELHEMPEPGELMVTVRIRLPFAHQARTVCVSVRRLLAARAMATA